MHYAAVFMEVLLLGYERLAETSLKLMHCVSIGSRKWLFIDGNIPCLQWWQYILLAYIVMFVLPFTFVLYWGSSKLNKSSITASEFLAACVLFPFLIHWICQTVRNRENETVPLNNQEVSKDVQVWKYSMGPFAKGRLTRKVFRLGEGLFFFLSIRLLRTECYVGFAS